MMDREKHIKLKHTKVSLLETLPKTMSGISHHKIVALHGWLDNAASFEKCAELMPHYHWFSIDCAGHGKSDHRADGSFYHLWDYVLDTVQLIETLNSKVWLLGHSMGASVAMLVAAVIPDKVHGLIMLDNLGPLTSQPTQRVSQLQHAINKMGVERSPSRGYESQEAMTLARMNGFTKLGHNAAQYLVLRGSFLDVDGRYRWRHDPKLTFPSPYRMDKDSVEAFIKGISCPSLILLAKEGIYSSCVDQAKEMIESFHTAELDWSDGGHHFHLEDESFQEVAHKVHHFISRH